MDGKKQTSWQSADYSLNFNANDDEFNFDNTDNLSNANDNNFPQEQVLKPALLFCASYAKIVLCHQFAFQKISIKEHIS